MSDGTFPGLVSKDRNLNALTNPIYVQLSDGSAALSITSGSLDVNITNLLLNVDDSAFAIGTDEVVHSGYLADEASPDSVDEGDVGIARMTLDRKQLFVLVDATVDSQRLEITASGNASVNISEQTLTAVKVSKDANANSSTNPIFVQTVNVSTVGDEIHNYDTTVDVASDTSDNHDYTVAGTTFFLKSVIASCSGSMRFEVQVGPLASLATVAVGFLTGRQGDTQQIFFDPAVEVPAASTGTVRVIRTNRQGTAVDVYSTIIGNDVA